MRIQTTRQPESSFLSLEKDMEIIVEHILKNGRLQKLLFDMSKKPLQREPLNGQEIKKLLAQNIKFTPKLKVDTEALNYLFITFSHFNTNPTNPKFRDNLIVFTILCHYDQWELEEFGQLRPYRIAAEIDTAFTNQKMTGIGTLEFTGATPFSLNDEFGGITIIYRAIHGGEDKKPMVNPEDWKDYQDEFDAIYNEE